MKGTITAYDAGKHFGFITDDGGQSRFFRESFWMGGGEVPAIGSHVVFDAVDDVRGLQAQNVLPGESEPVAQEITNSHRTHCFIVMPYGRDADEVRWYRGWYETVIRPAVSDSGYEPILSSAEEKPNAINDEIRTHLAVDPMAVVDLAGIDSEDPPNPNVMYELGIRHAFSLPLVMLAWKDQRLPFDISNQRVIMERRELLDLETNRVRILSFIEAARGGDYYRPMDAVGRSATLDMASMALDPNSLLGALTREVRELRQNVRPRAAANRSPRVRSLKMMATTKAKRNALRKVYLDNGGPEKYWGAVLAEALPESVVNASSAWGTREWQNHVIQKAQINAKKDAERKAKASIGTDTEPGADVGPVTDTEPGADVGPVTDTEPGADVGPVTDTEPGADAATVNADAGQI